MMTAKRAKILIACAWIVSFLICFPPLVHTGWNQSDQQGSGLIEINITEKTTINLHSTHPSSSPFTHLPINQYSSNSYSPKETKHTVELNRWSNSIPFYTSNKFFHKSGKAIYCVYLYCKKNTNSGFTVKPLLYRCK